MIFRLIERFSSRKFLTAVGCYVIVLLAGLGVAHFPDGVLAAATGALIAYIGAQGVIDARNGS